MTYPLLFRHKVLSVQEKEGLTIAQVAARSCVEITNLTRRLGGNTKDIDHMLPQYDRHARGRINMIDALIDKCLRW